MTLYDASALPKVGSRKRRRLVADMPPTQRALAKIVEAFLRLDKRQEKLESIVQAALRLARPHPRSRSARSGGR